MAGQDTVLIDLVLAGALTTGVQTAPGAVVVVPCGLEVIGAWVHMGTAPAGSAAIFNVQRTKLADGSTSQLWTTAGNRPTVADGAANSVATTGSSPNITATKPPGPDTADLTMGDVLQLNVIQIGSGTAGSDATLTLQCEKN